MDPDGKLLNRINLTVSDHDYPNFIALEVFTINVRSEFFKSIYLFIYFWLCWLNLAVAWLFSAL